MLQKMFIFMLILGIFHISNAQDTQWGKPNFDPGYNQSTVDFSKIGGTNMSNTDGYQPERVISAEEKQLLAEQRAAKIADTAGPGTCSADQARPTPDYSEIRTHHQL